MRRELRRAQILQSAREVFAENGYHRASVADIIGRAGVARGTFYLYFESKRAVFEELLERLMDAIQSDIKRLPTDGDVAVVLSELRDNLDAVMETLVGNPAMARILFHEAVGLDEGFDAKLAQFYGQVGDLIAESLVDGQGMGLVRPMDTRLTARFLLGALKEVLFELTLSGGTLDDVAWTTDEVLHFFLRGIAEPSFLAALTTGARPPRA